MNKNKKTSGLKTLTFSTKKHTEDIMTSKSEFTTKFEVFFKSATNEKS